MGDLLLLDPEAAGTLVNHLAWTAEALDANRGPLRLDLDETGGLLDVCPFPHDLRLEALAEQNRADARDLGTRVRSVVFGGEGFNSGLRALAEIRPAFGLIETRGGQFGADGVLSRDDLEWAAEHLHGEAAAAAAWLIANPAFLAAVATAEGDDDYLEDLYRDGFIDGDGGGWADRAPLALGALDAFEAHVGAWSTLIFSGAEIDIAAHGGETDGVLSKADFEAFLARPDLPPELRAAAQRVLDDGAWHDTGGIDFLSILDWATFVPVLGDAIDGAMMLYYLAKGDMANAVAHGVGLVPIPGLSGGAVKGAKELATSVAARYVDDGVSGVARLTARETTQSFVTATIADEVEDVAAQYTDNPYLLATLNVVVDARLGQAADGYRTGLAAGTGASPSATTTPPTDAEIATSLHDTHMFLEEMNAYIDETNDFLGSLDTPTPADPGAQRAELLGEIDRLIADIDAVLAE